MEARSDLPEFSGVKGALLYGVGERRYRGTLIAPANPVRAIAVLLPDWRGQSPLAHDHAAHLAACGCLVAIADLYGDGFSPTSPDQVGAMVQRLVEHRHEGVAALAACVAALRAASPDPALPTFCLGYSAGGMIALDYGRSGVELDGIIVCSGLLKTAGEGMEKRIRSRVLIVQGTRDQVTPIQTVEAVIAEMDEVENDAQFLLLSQTHHAFDNPDAGIDPNARLVYSPRSARRVERVITRFVEDALSGRNANEAT